MTVAVTYQFNYTVPGRLAGFSETHYLPDYTNPDSADAKTRATLLAEKRVLLLGAGAALVGVRLSDVDSDRDSVLLSVGDVFNPGTISPTPDPATLAAYGQADQPNAAVQVRMGASSKAWKNIFLGGVPDKVIDTQFRTVNVGACPLWATNFGNWSNLIAPAAGGVWAYKGNHRGGEGGIYAPIKILGWQVEALAPSRIGFTIATPGGGWTNGTKVHVEKVTVFNRGYRTPIGDWIVNNTVADAGAGTTTFFLRGSEGINIDNIDSMGFARLKITGYFKYTFAQIIQYTTRKRGVGSVRQRGKSRRTVQRV